MFRRLQHLLEMIRFSHTLFALPFALLAAVMAWTAPTTDGSRIAFSWLHLAAILVCMVSARSAAMAFNRIADRHLDAENPRTARRHLPAGLLSLATAVGFTSICSMGFVLGTLMFLPNVLPLLLSLPVLVFLFAYSFTKRFTSLAHFWLGAALMLAPVSVWIALRGDLVWQQPADLLPAILLGLAVLTWVAGFDIIYACQDVEFDAQAQLRSIPVRLGVAGALRLAAWCHAGMLIVLAVLPWLASGLGLGWIYGVGIAAATVLLVCEHRLVRPDDLSRVNAAFFHANWMLSLGLLVLGSVDLLT
ncbi:MAG: putative 4-hydroxybenzoate polyprenyltransferase [Pirellulaceae bacterium]|nr:putative 4-hydroxybenzoate polyprenyltransferase [Pirellulaceae bacterium]